MFSFFGAIVDFILGMIVLGFLCLIFFPLILFVFGFFGIILGIFGVILGFLFGFLGFLLGFAWLLLKICFTVAVIGGVCLLVMTLAQIFLDKLKGY